MSEITDLMYDPDLEAGQCCPFLEDFAEGLAKLRRNLDRLERFVVCMKNANDFGLNPIVSPFQVEKDLILLKHLDTGLARATSQLIGLRATARTAQAEFKQEMRAAAL